MADSGRMQPSAEYGDIVFSNLSVRHSKERKVNVDSILIPFREIEKPRPKAETVIASGCRVCRLGT